MSKPSKKILPTAIDKKCTKCGEVKTLNDFYVDNRRPEGFYSACKECHNKAKKRDWPNVKMIKCACGCGNNIKQFDYYGTSRRYMQGHGTRKYDNPIQARRELNKTYSRNKRFEKKEILVLYKGGKCESCGLEYDRTNGCIFDFHHTSVKNFVISKNMMDRSLETLKKEIDNCLLLCSNCHRTKHTKKY